MARISITCSDCTADTPHAGAGHARHPRPGEFLGPLGQLSEACLCCGRLVTAEREVAHLLRPITASVCLLDDGIRSGAVAEDDTDSSAPPRPHAERQTLAHHSFGRTS